MTHLKAKGEIFMDIVSILILAAALAMDAFGVSVSDGIIIRRIRLRDACKIGLFFGGFQFIMPCIGSFLAGFAMRYIESFDHWIAFGLLVILGIKMIIEALKEEKEVPKKPLGLATLTLMAIATSIDALAAGITVAAVGTPILMPAVIIGVVAFGFSFSGLYIGSRFGDILGEKAEILGGIMLILIGVKTLTEHLMG